MNISTLFSYISYRYTVNNNILSAVYHFRTLFNGRRVDFFPSLEFVAPRKFFNNCFNIKNIDELVFSLGMVEAISYWKASCPQSFFIECHNMTEKQMNWWKKTFFYGLGEFRYLNNIYTDFENFVDFYPTKSFAVDNRSNIGDKPNLNQIIVPIGGGKDSIVTLEQLKNDHTIIPFAINPNPTINACIAATGYSPEETFVVNRHLDETLLQINAQGALNGHTPFSTIVAFASLIAAELTGSSLIALSNEASASESTVKSANDIINHQYSKSFAFEADFRRYYKDYISTKYEYFSYLRQINELKIAELFSNLDKYHPIFKSCNKGTKKGHIWCGDCPKCLFVYIILMPFISQNKLTEIFGGNLLENLNLQATLYELTGLSDNKPFECVGTIKETKAAIAKYLETNEPTGILLEYVKKYPANQLKLDRAVFDAILNHHNGSNFIPEHLCKK